MSVRKSQVQAKRSLGASSRLQPIAATAKEQTRAHRHQDAHRHQGGCNQARIDQGDRQEDRTSRR